MGMADEIAAGFMKDAGHKEPDRKEPDNDEDDHGAMLIKAVKANNPAAVNACIRACVDEYMKGGY